MQKITMLLDCGKLKNRVIIIYDLLLIIFQQKFNYLDNFQFYLTTNEYFFHQFTS